MLISGLSGGGRDYQLPTVCLRPSWLLLVGPGLTAYMPPRVCNLGQTKRSIAHQPAHSPPSITLIPRISSRMNPGMRPTFLRGAEGRERPPLCLSVGMLSRRMPACPGSHATGPRPLPTQGLPRRSAIRRYDCFKEPLTGNSAIAPAPPHRQSEPSQTDDLAEPPLPWLRSSFHIRLLGFVVSMGEL